MPARVTRVVALACLVKASAVLAQLPATATITGITTDEKGGALPNARLVVHGENKSADRHATSDATGHFTVSGLPSGHYQVQADVAGFTTVQQNNITLLDGGSAEVDLTLHVASATEQITVEADVTHSAAAALAPMDALLDETSAKTEITSAFINNFASPVADYGEAVEMAPSTFTLNGNGVGLGQSKTFFRGFPDGEYDIKFDGIPFSDTNSVSHHSWAFFPSQFLGGIDFDRSPGTASTVGFAPFGGFINLLSKEMSPVRNIRATFSGGSYNTYLYDAEYDSGAFGPGKKLNMNVDVHHMQSHGYQTGNNQRRDAGEIKVAYALSDKTTITGFSGVIQLNANTPNFNATRCQMYGAQTGYTCTGTLAPFAGAGINFLLTNNSDPNNYIDDEYNFYHVPTDFEYVGLHKEFGKGFVLNVKPYTYNYDNSEKYSNATPITEATTINGAKTYNGLAIQPCNVPVVSTSKKTGISVVSLPCSVDKYNSYRQYGETSELTQVSRFGTLRAGAWYNWGRTNRHQYSSDPLNNYQDYVLPNFAEKFVQDSVQPFVEYRLNVGRRLSVTPGVKFSYFNIGTQQFADNGSTIGCLVAGCNVATGANINPNASIANGGSYFATLPSAVANYRVRNNWSAYFQFAEGTIAPPSSVFDFQQGTSGSALPPAVLPKQQLNRTYQTGTVFKLKYVTFDADYFHVHFDNSYSSTLNAAGEPVFFAQPASITQGLEGESNIYLTHGLSVYLNASFDKATYTGSLSATCTGSTAACAAAGPLYVTAPAGLNVQQTPSDVETEGVTYQRHGFDAGYFNKRVGTYYLDNGSYHNQAAINPFSLSNVFVNYTLRTNGAFDGTKFRFSVNNLTDSHSMTGDSIKGSANTITLNANGTTYTDPFNTNGQTPINGADAISILPGRSVMLTVTFGLSPKR